MPLFLRLMLPALGLVVACGTHAATATCGTASFEVTVEHRGHPLDNRYQLFGRTAPGAEPQLLHTSDIGGWFYAACLQGERAVPLLVFQAFCGGSACVEDRYGIVETSTLHLLLAPGTGNTSNGAQAAALLKRAQPPDLSRAADTFCCDAGR